MEDLIRLDLPFSLSGSQSLHSDSCKTFISGQLSVTLLPLPPTGSAGSLSERGQASPPSLCVAGGLEGSFLRALCLVNQAARPLCSKPPQVPLPFPLHQGWQPWILFQPNLTHSAQLPQSGWKLLVTPYKTWIPGEPGLRL